MLQEIAGHAIIVSNDNSSNQYLLRLNILKNFIGFQGTVIN